MLLQMAHPLKVMNCLFRTPNTHHEVLGYSLTIIQEQVFDSHMVNVGRWKMVVDRDWLSSFWKSPSHPLAPRPPSVVIWELLYVPCPTYLNSDKQLSAEPAEGEFPSPLLGSFFL